MEINEGSLGVWCITQAGEELTMGATDKQQGATVSPLESRAGPGVSGIRIVNHFRKRWTAFGSTALIVAGLLAGVGFAAPALPRQTRWSR
ncbi:hypothetical protein AHiyo1_11700 [Arthrobacter sp. Hiyo1]|nr:hypothetical protein AHiyo1_11700 [Arthrobacter sp. Hiyo1]